LAQTTAAARYNYRIFTIAVGKVPLSSRLPLKVRIARPEGPGSELLKYDKPELTLSGNPVRQVRMGRDSTL